MPQFSTMSKSLLVQTTHAQIFKNAFEILAEVFEEIDMQFDKDGLQIIQADNTLSCVVHVRLDANAFDTYECNKTTLIVCGINTQMFCKILNNCGSDEFISLSVDDNSLHLIILFKNKNDNVVKYYHKMKFTTTCEREIRFPPQEFDVTFSMPCKIFVNILDIFERVDHFKLECSPDKVGFICPDNNTTSVFFDAHLFAIKSRITTSFNNVYEIKLLRALTSDIESIAYDVDIYTKANYPLIIGCTIGTLGYFRVLIQNIKIEQ